jgi:hypothetical protein
MAEFYRRSCQGVGFFDRATGVSVTEPMGPVHEDRRMRLTDVRKADRVLLD